MNRKAVPGQTSVAYRGLALTPVKLPGVPGGARLSVREIQIDGPRVWVSNTDMPLYPPTASLSLSLVPARYFLLFGAIHK